MLCRSQGLDHKDPHREPRVSIITVPKIRARRREEQKMEKKNGTVE
jgi:hypothetical protein